MSRDGTRRSGSARGRTLAVGWTLAVLAIALFCTLGTWQARRAVEKQAMLDAAAGVLAERRSAPRDAAADPARARDFDWYVARGRFDAQPPLLLDNQLRGGRAGVRVYRLFTPAGVERPLLVDLGWLPLAGDRALPPLAPLPAGDVELRGLLAPPPSTGLELGAAMARRDDAWLMTRVDLAAIAEALDPAAALSPRALRLDPDLPLGHTRDLALLANTLPPDKHRGYALQWFALALAVLVTALVLSLRKKNA